MGGKSDAPAAPNYTALANLTASSSEKMNRESIYANRPKQYTPYGSNLWEVDPYGNWSQYITFSPSQQKLFDAQNALSQQYAGLAQQGANSVAGVLAHPGIDTSKLPAEQINAGQTAQQAILSRLEPQIQRDRQGLASDLANQGIALGSDAYKNAKELQGQQENDLRLAAALRGIDVGQQARQQAIQEQSTINSEPLNILNALRTGSQVANPSFGSFAQQQPSQGVDYLKAGQQQYQSAMQQYNAQQQADNSFFNGLLGAGTSLFSFL